MSVSVTLVACRLPGGVGGEAAIAAGAATSNASVAAAIEAALVERIDPPPKGVCDYWRARSSMHSQPAHTRSATRQFLTPPQFVRPRTTACASPPAAGTL